MSLGAYSDMPGAPSAGATYSDLVGTVLDGSGPYDLDGTVSRSAINSWDGDSVFFRPRVRLAGEFIPDDEICAPISISDSDIDSHTSSFRFGLRGKRWSAGVTEKVFALTAADIFLDHGVEGAVVEPTTPDYAGYVIGSDQDDNGEEPQLVVQCGDEAAAWEKYEACEEVAPGAGYTRGEIVELLCQAAGITAIDIPDGAVYTKPLQATNKRLFDVLRPFVEPEGWRIRFSPDRTLRIEVPEIKRPPLAPDFTWTKGDCIAMRAVPPENAPSRWVLTSNMVVEASELGVTTETTTTTLEALYAPKIATEQQQTDGSKTATGFPSEPEAVRPVRKIVDVVSKQGGQVVMQRTQEWAWKNLSSARLASIGTGGGTAGGGYSYRQVYISEDGDYVQWWKEKFLLIGDRIAIYSYDGDGNLVSTDVRTSRWKLTEMGVRTVGSSASATSVVNAFVHGDDQSYQEEVEAWGVAEQQVITVEFGEDGALLSTQQDSYKNFNPRTRVDGAPAATYFVMYNGEAQKGLVATWSLVETKVESNIIGDDLSLKGTTTTTEAWNAREKKDGPNDFGTYKSNMEEQAFQLIAIDHKQFNVVNEDQYEQVTYAADGSRVAQIFLGRIPTTRYISSEWTRLLTQPLEVKVDDATAQEWFGFERETLTHEYVQNDAEALVVINARRRRALALKLEVTRPDTLAKRGDTIYFSAPEDGIDRRFIVVDRERDWSSIMPRATYTLEAW